MIHFLVPDRRREEVVKSKKKKMIRKNYLVAFE
jgi:hypothetical protein